MHPKPTFPEVHASQARQVVARAAGRMRSRRLATGVGLTIALAFSLALWAGLLFGLWTLLAR